MSNEMKDGMVDVHAEVVSSKEVKTRGWLKTFSTIFKTIVGIIIFPLTALWWIGNNGVPVVIEWGIPVVRKTFQFVEVVAVVLLVVILGMVYHEMTTTPAKEDLAVVHRDAVEKSLAVRYGTETEIRSWWVAKFYSNKKITDMAITAAIGALDAEKIDKPVEAIAEINKVQNSLRLEQSQLRIKGQIQAAVKK